MEDSPSSNSWTEDLPSVLTDLGARGTLILKTVIPNHRLPSWNRILEKPLPERIAEKRKSRDLAEECINDTSLSLYPTEPT